MYVTFHDQSLLPQRETNVACLVSSLFAGDALEAAARISEQHVKLFPPLSPASVLEFTVLQASILEHQCLMNWARAILSNSVVWSWP